MEPVESLSTQNVPSLPDTCVQTPLLPHLGKRRREKEGTGQRRGRVAHLVPGTQDVPGAKCLEPETSGTWLPLRLPAGSVALAVS